jgi:hypothetical protein
MARGMLVRRTRIDPGDECCVDERMLEPMADRAPQNPVRFTHGRARGVVTARLDARGQRGENVTTDADHNVMTTPLALGFIVIALLLAARPAAACPANSPCLKYKNRTVEIQPLYYVRDAASPLPRFSERNVTRFLMLSLWTPVFAEPDPKVPMAAPAPGVHVTKDTRKVRFVDPEHVPPPRTNTRDAYAGQIMRTDGFTYVDVYGQTFLLTTCAKAKKRACLEPFAKP